LENNLSVLSDRGLEGVVHVEGTKRPTWKFPTLVDRREDEEKKPLLTGIFQNRKGKRKILSGRKNKIPTVIPRLQ